MTERDKRVVYAVLCILLGALLIGFVSGGGTGVLIASGIFLLIVGIVSFFVIVG